MIPGSKRSSGKGIGYPLQYSWASLVAQQVKKSSCNAEDLGSVPGLGRSPGEGKGYPLQHSGLENSMDCIVHGVTESDTAEQLSLSLCRFWGLQLEKTFGGHYKTCCNLVRKEIIIQLFYR